MVQISSTEQYFVEVASPYDEDWYRIGPPYDTKSEARRMVKSKGFQSVWAKFRTRIIFVREHQFAVEEVKICRK